MTSIDRSSTSVTTGESESGTYLETSTRKAAFDDEEEATRYS
ncbi:MAG: hypothetical protein ACYCTE_05705 [Acidimicrobiales bacterium]